MTTPKGFRDMKRELENRQQSNTNTNTNTNKWKEKAAQIPIQ